MSRSVTGELKEEPMVIVEKLRKLAVKHDIEFDGDAKTGWAKGKGFTAVYEVQGNQCTLTITKKPRLVPWMVVENAIKKLFD